MRSWGGRGHKYRVRLSTIGWPRLASLSVWIRVIDKCTPCINEGVSFCRKLANYELARYKSEPAGINCGATQLFSTLDIAIGPRIGCGSGVAIIFGVFVIIFCLTPVLWFSKSPRILIRPINKTFYVFLCSQLLSFTYNFLLQQNSSICSSWAK